MMTIAVLAKQLHNYFPNGYCTIQVSAIVHVHSGMSLGYWLDVQEIDVHKNFDSFSDLRKFAVNLMLARYTMLPVDKPLMFSDFEKKNTNSDDNQL
mgnify:CR=1 FL=1